MLKMIYSKLVLALGMALGFAILYINVLKRSALEKELKETNKKLEYKDKAQRALLNGLRHEGTPHNRGHFDK